MSQASEAFTLFSFYSKVNRLATTSRKPQKPQKAIKFSLFSQKPLKPQFVFENLKKKCKIPNFQSHIVQKVICLITLDWFPWINYHRIGSK